MLRHYLLLVGSYRENACENAPFDGLSGISRERVERGPPNFTDFSGTIGLTNWLDMTSLDAYGGLQNL